MLTIEQIKLLEQPFDFEEHGAVRGNPYILKSAIIRRLNDVDPAWTTTPPVEDVDWHNGFVNVRAGMVVAGVERHAYGTGIAVLEKTDRKTGEIHPLPVYEIQRQMSKALKSAQSDLVPRCALMFGVGQYLRDYIKDDNNNQRNLSALLDIANRKWYSRWHWASNGKADEFRQHMTALGLEPDYVKAHLEPGHEIVNLNDITLPFNVAMRRLDALAE